MNIKNRIYTVLLFFLLASGVVNAQENDKSGHIRGKAVDSKSGQPLEFATAALYTVPKDSLIGGVLIAATGEFSFNNVPWGIYKLRIRFIGYNDFEQNIPINAKNMHQDLGVVKVDLNATQLNEVDIVADKPVMQMSIDKKIFNVEKDLSVKGGTGMDALKNIPGVSIDSDGSITLRNNSNVIIYIDGRITNLTMDQIPADQIESIEIITNPSAKYDANTSGGIINVVLKRNTKGYLNGSLIGGIGTNNKYNATATLNQKSRLFNFTGIFSYNTATNYVKQYTIRDNITNPAPIKYYNEYDLDGLVRTTAMAKVSLDYYMNEKNTITVGGTYNLGQFIANDNQNFTSRDSSNNLYSVGDRYNANTNTFNNYVGLLSHKRTFEKKGQEWTSTIQYTSGATGGGYLYTTYMDTVGQTIPERGPTRQNNSIDGHNHIYLLQSDFVKPINDSTKLEFGIKSTYKRTQSLNITNDFSYPTNEYVYDSVFSNNYLINDLVNAAYVNYTKRIRKINIQAGLRFEDSYYQGLVLNKANENFGYSYPSSASTIAKSLFPALYISKKVNSNSEFQINFSRKINRPNFFQLLPVVTSADNFNYALGNPRLQPEFANKAEINYNYTTDKVNYLTSIYGQYTQNSIVNYLYPSATNPDILINSYKNSAGTFTYGWENIAKVTLWKKLTVTGTITPYYTLIEYTSVYGVQGTSEGWSQNSKLVISYKLPRDFTLQTNGTYEAPKPLAQGETTNQRYFDLALSKTIKKRFFINLLLSDVLNIKQKGKNYYTPEYTQLSMNRREARYLKLNFTWTFGKPDTSKKKGNKPANDNGNDYDQL